MGRLPEIIDGDHIVVHTLYMDTNKGNKMKTLKVGSWFKKLSKKQQQDFIFLFSKTKRFGVNEVRSFLSGVKKAFGEDIQLTRIGYVEVDGCNYAFIFDRKEFIKLGN